MNTNLPTADDARRKSDLNRQHNDELVKLENLAKATIEAASSTGLRCASLFVRNDRADLVHTLMYNLKDQGFASRLEAYDRLTISW